MSITIVGMGMASPGTLTAEALEALGRAELVIGAQRLLAAVDSTSPAEKHAAIDPVEIARLIERTPGKAVCILMSGDTGFYSGTKKLLEQLGHSNTTILPGLSSVQYFSARLKRPWQDWKLVSAHGKQADVVAVVRENSETFFLTGGVMNVQSLCAQLVSAGLGALTVSVGENLGADNERLTVSTAHKLSQAEHDDLAVMLVDNPSPGRTVSCGLPDDAFIRGITPMTKSEVRSVILSKLRLRDTDIVYDIGAGTGSVSVEAALLARNGRVWSFERNEEGRQLISDNACRFSVSNIEIVAGKAPLSFDGLEAPDAAFIGGSGGSLKEILEALLSKNSQVRFVISAVALETLSEAAELMAKLPVRHAEIVQVAVSRTRPVGGYHMMTAMNPVFILSAEGCPDKANG